MQNQISLSIACLVIFLCLVESGLAKQNLINTGLKASKEQLIESIHLNNTNKFSFLGNTNRPEKNAQATNKNPKQQRKEIPFEIKEPSEEKIETTNQNVRISGTADPSHKKVIIIGKTNQDVPISAKGDWQTNLSLDEGENIIKIGVNSSSKKLVLIRKKSSGKPSENEAENEVPPIKKSNDPNKIEHYDSLKITNPKESKIEWKENTILLEGQVDRRVQIVKVTIGEQEFNVPVNEGSWNKEITLQEGLNIIKISDANENKEIEVTLKTLSWLDRIKNTLLILGLITLVCLLLLAIYGARQIRQNGFSFRSNRFVKLENDIKMLKDRYEELKKGGTKSLSEQVDNKPRLSEHPTSKISKETNPELEIKALKEDVKYLKSTLNNLLNNQSKIGVNNEFSNKVSSKRPLFPSETNKNNNQVQRICDAYNNAVKSKSSWEGFKRSYNYKRLGIPEHIATKRKKDASAELSLEESSTGNYIAIEIGTDYYIVLPIYGISLKNLYDFGGMKEFFECKNYEINDFHQYPYVLKPAIFSYLEQKWEIDDKGNVDFNYR